MRASTAVATGAAVAATAVVGSLAGGGAGSPWFRSLRRPAIQPPGVVFPVVWTALYTDVAVTSAVVLDRSRDRGGRGDEAARGYARALAVNLVLNASWSWVFFRAHRLREASALAGVLALSSADLARRAGVVSPAAGAALAPYAGWCAFATVLSGAVARANPHR